MHRMYAMTGHQIIHGPAGDYCRWCMRLTPFNTDGECSQELRPKRPDQPIAEQLPLFDDPK